MLTFIFFFIFLIINIFNHFEIHFSMMIQKQVIGFGMEGCDFIVGQVSLPL